MSELVRLLLAFCAAMAVTVIGGFLMAWILAPEPIAFPVQLTCPPGSRFCWQLLDDRQ